MSANGKNTAGRVNGRKRPKGYYEWRPQKKTVALLKQVDDVLTEYHEHLPLTVRQIFYRLVATIGYEKTETAYSRLAEAVVLARRARMIAFDSIRDDGIVHYPPSWFDDVEDFWNYVGGEIKGYSRDRQAGQPQRIEVWCEAGGMAPQLARVANPFSINVYSNGGFSSLTAVRSIVDRAKNRDVPTVLLHVGDYDPSGVSIFQALAEDAAAFLEDDRLLALQRIDAERVALTEEQIREHNLPTAPAKQSDSRSRSWRGGTCQLEALPPDVLADTMSDAITRQLQWWKIEEQLEREKTDRAELWRGLPRGSE